RSDLHLDRRERETHVLALHHLAEAFGPAAALTTENGQQGGPLFFVAALVHEDRVLEVAGVLPNVAAERPDHRDVEAVELYVAVAAFLDVPDENALAELVVRRLGPGARTWDRAPAHVEPLTLEPPLLDLGHDSPLLCKGSGRCDRVPLSAR